jgi:muramoyltetrapeptide carboxypeptidase
MSYPRRVIVPGLLERGDVVRVIAPASPFDPEMLAQGVVVLRDRMGLEPRHRADLFMRRRYLAGDDARRLDEWREAVADDEARAIFCARGGYGSMRILRDVDPAPLLARPKVLVGFSDVTALHAALNRAGLATIHGPVLTQLGRAPAAAIDHLTALLTRAPAPERSGDPSPGAGLVGQASVRPGRAEGPLLGGSLTMLAHLCGTPFLPSLQGAILAIEDVDERPYRLDRYLTQLRLAGALEGLAGVALGQFTDCDGQGIRGLEVVREWAAELGVPAAEGFAFGHEDANFAFPLGLRAELISPADGEAGPPRLLFTGWAERGPQSQVEPRAAGK